MSFSGCSRSYTPSGAADGGGSAVGLGLSSDSVQRRGGQELAEGGVTARLYAGCAQAGRIAVLSLSFLCDIFSWTERLLFKARVWQYGDDVWLDGWVGGLARSRASYQWGFNLLRHQLQLACWWDTLCDLQCMGYSPMFIR